MMFGKRKHKHNKCEQQSQDVTACASAGSTDGPAGPVDRSESTHSNAASSLRAGIRRLRDKVIKGPSPVALSVTSANSSNERQSERTSTAQELPSAPPPDVQTIETAAPEVAVAEAAAVLTPPQILIAESHSSPNTPSLEPQSQSLWDRAYDALRESDTSLVEKYEILLDNVEKLSPDEELENASESTPTRKPLVATAHHHNTSTQRHILDAVIARGLKRMEANRSKYTVFGHTFSPRDQLSKAADLVLWAKTWIAEAVKSSPEASIAWAGVSIVLPLLTKPKTAEDDNCDGFTAVTFRMCYYTELEHMLQRLGRNPGVSTGLLEAADSQIVNLYKHIIKYQILSAVRYFKTSLRRYAGDVFLQVDWKQMQTEMEELDETVSRILIQIGQLAAREELELLNETSKSALASARELLSVSMKQLRVQEEHRDLSAALLQAHREAMQKQLSEKEERCLQLFRLTSGDKDATYEWYKGRVEDRVQDTCNWFLQHPNFQSWWGSESGPLLVSADPGCGKSVLAKFLIDHELKKLPNTTICYFFFKDQDQCTTRQALCALLHQLLSAKPFLVKYAMGPYTNEGNGLANSTNSLWSILKQAVQDELTGPVVLVLDALDECAEPDFEDLMRKISYQFSGDRQGCEKLRYLFTSRPYEQIVSRFRGLLEEFPYVRIPGEDQSDEISREVNQVINHRVDQLAKEQLLSSRVKDHLRQRLCKIEHRTYLWVYLVFDHLRAAGFKKTERGIEAAIDTLPRNVSEAYEQILNKSRNTPMVRKALGIILAAYKPLTLSKMNVAINIKRSGDLDLESDEDFKSTLRSWCGLFVSVYHDKVYFLHQTAREFLLGSMSSAAMSPMAPLQWNGSFTMQDAHRIIAESCVHYLLLTSGPQVEDTGSGSDSSSICYAFMAYSATEWNIHFREANIGDTVVIRDAVALCSQNKASWVASREYRNGRLSMNSEEDLWGLELVSALCLEPVARYMLDQGASVSGDGHSRQTPICWASKSGDAATVQLLLERRADVSEAASNRNTPLLLASGLGHDAVVELLLKYGANTESIDDWDRTPLLLSCGKSYEATAKLLLDSGADIEAKDNEGMTPLLLSCKAGHEAIAKLLLDSGADIEAKDNKGMTPLLYACAGGKEAVARLLLERGAGIEAKNKDGMTPLLLAATRRHESLACLLLDKNANVNAVSNDGTTALLAASRMSANFIRMMVYGGADVKARNSRGDSVLHGAVTFDDAELVRMLLDKGVEVNTSGNHGWTPLHVASETWHGAVIRLLLDRGANIHARSKIGRTPLMSAAHYSRNTAIRLLLEAGADIDAQDDDGLTPLMYAARRGNEAVIKLLLTASADIEAKDAGGLTPLMYAIQSDENTTTESLLKAGANYEARDSGGLTPLMYAARRGNEAGINLLLTASADIEAKDAGGLTPLMYAIQSTENTTTESLLKAGANFEARDIDGWTPLMYAARDGNEAVLKLLLTTGADIEAKDADGWTPLTHACLSEYYPERLNMLLLLSNGADVNAVKLVGKSRLQQLAENEDIRELLQEYHFDWPSGVLPS